MQLPAKVLKRGSLGQEWAGELDRPYKGLIFKVQFHIGYCPSILFLYFARLCRRHEKNEEVYDMCLQLGAKRETEFS